MSEIQISGSKCPDFSHLGQFQSTNNTQLSIDMLNYSQFLSISDDISLLKHDFDNCIGCKSLACPS